MKTRFAQDHLERASMCHQLTCGRSLTIFDAIMRYGNEADVVMHNVSKLTDAQKTQLLKFLEAL